MGAQPLNPLANAGIRWFAIALLYLAVQPAWDLLGRWMAGWRGRVGAGIAALEGASCAEALRAAGWLVYRVGVPYVALLLGLADAQYLGLAGLTWWPALPLGAAVGLGSVLLLIWSWGRVAPVLYQRRARRRLFLAERRALRTSWGWVLLIVEAVGLQASWAFVRGGAISVAGLYPGVFLGLALVAGVWLLRPGHLAALANPDCRAQALLTGELALISGLVFLYSENLWLCILMHILGLTGAVFAGGRGRARAAAD